MHWDEASMKLVPQKYESPGMYGSIGAGVGASGSLQVVWMKQDSPKGHSLDDPVGQGVSHLEASSKEVPHMNESVFSHDV